MAKHYFVVLSNPKEGRAKEFADWYDGRHLMDVASVPGISGATRYELTASVGAPPNSWQFQSLAIYDIEVDDPMPVLKTIEDWAMAGKMPISDALDTDGVRTFLYRKCKEAKA